MKKTLPEWIKWISVPLVALAAWMSIQTGFELKEHQRILRLKHADLVALQAMQSAQARWSGILSARNGPVREDLVTLWSNRVGAAQTRRVLTEKKLPGGVWRWRQTEWTADMVELSRWMDFAGQVENSIPPAQITDVRIEASARPGFGRTVFRLNEFLPAIP